MTFSSNSSYSEHVWYKNPLCAIPQCRVFNTSLSLYFHPYSCLYSKEVVLRYNACPTLYISLGSTVAMEIDDLSHKVTEAPKGF